VKSIWLNYCASVSVMLFLNSFLLVRIMPRLEKMPTAQEPENEIARRQVVKPTLCMVLQDVSWNLWIPSALENLDLAIAGKETIAAAARYRWQHRSSDAAVFKSDLK